MGAVRQKIEKLFDYCGDNARNAGREGARAYSATFSPNNIRAVVISPNGVLVRYHLPVNGRSHAIAQFNERELYAEECEPKYKPILRMLAHPLVCASVEEIIVLSSSLSGVVHQSYMNEIELRSMIQSYGGASSDLKSSISGRFGRLRYYAVLNINFNTFVGYYSNVIKNGILKRDGLMCELQAIKNSAQLEELAGEDYWKSYGYQPTYAFDETLRKHFEAIKSKREAEIKSKAVEEVRDKRVGGKIRAINEMIEEYITCNRLWSRFCKVAKSEGSSGIVPNLDFVEQPEVFKLLKFKGMVTVPDALLDSRQCSEDEAFAHNESVLKGYKLKFAKATACTFFKGLDVIASRGEITLLKTIVNGCETLIAVPPHCQDSAAKIAQMTGVQFNGRDIDTSIVNSCSMFMRYFVAYQHKDVCTRDYWGSRLKTENGKEARAK